jgi:antitoxin component YwqK of YwqJK toxin-antitoxin module
MQKKQTINEEGLTVKYHANGQTIWSKGKIVNGLPEGYWQWFRIDGTLKRAGYFNQGKPYGLWTTFDQLGKPYKTTMLKNEINLK